MLCGALWLLACQSPELSTPRASAVGQAAATPAPAAARSFGAPSSVPGEPVDVAEVLKDPSSYLQRSIKCRGTVARVCQAAGCWLELQAPARGEAGRAAAAGGEGLRVPMAGHAFFVPQDIVGKTAVVEGRLAARELLDAERAHLTGEGLRATGPLFLEATGVVVR